MIVNSHENFGPDIGYAKIIRILDTLYVKQFLAWSLFIFYWVLQFHPAVK